LIRFEKGGPPISQNWRNLQELRQSLSDLPSISNQ